MASNKRPVVANLDFDSLKTDLIDHFKSNSQFKDYEFTGSSMNMLMEILAYNTHYNSLTANFLSNEMFMDSAVLRKNIVSIAKMMNYVPRSSTSASATVVINVPRQLTEQIAIIPAGTIFNASSGNESFNFYLMEDKTIQYDTLDVARDISLVVKEGELVHQRFTHTNSTAAFPFFQLQNKKIDTTTLNVSVNGVSYTEITPEKEGITDTNFESTVFFVQENRDGLHEIFLGNGVVGKKLEIGDQIVVSYLVTNERDGNGISTFSVSISGRPDASVVSSTVSQGGDEPESIREIKSNAPHWFQSQYRAVTTNDYETIIRKKFSDIQSISVYGGEDIGQPGKVFIAIRPKSADALSASVKDTLVNVVLNDSSVMTITPTIVDPTFLDIILKTVVVYDDSKLITNADTLKAKVFVLMGLFNTTYIGGFLANFYNSALVRETYDLDDSIQSVNTRVSLKIDITSKNQILSAFNFTFGNKIYHPEAGYKESVGGVVYSSMFTRVGQTFQSGFDDDGNGALRMFDLIDGTKVYSNLNAGKISYDTGTVEITTNLTIDDGTIEFFATPDSFDIVATGNTILRIVSNKSLVETIEKNNSTQLKALSLSRSQ